METTPKAPHLFVLLSKPDHRGHRFYAYADEKDDKPETYNVYVCDDSGSSPSTCEDKFVKIVRDDLPVREDTHSSELDWSSFRPDAVVHNTFDSLQEWSQLAGPAIKAALSLRDPDAF